MSLRRADHPSRGVLPSVYTSLRVINYNDKHLHLQLVSFRAQTKKERSPRMYSYCTWCGRKVMRLATLWTNRQRYCLPLHMAVRLTPAVDSVQVWTCYSCYAIVKSVWNEVVFLRCFTKMDRQKFEQSCVIKFCVKLGESATVTYEKLQRAYGEHSLPRAQVFSWHKSFLEGR